MEVSGLLLCVGNYRLHLAAVWEFHDPRPNIVTESDHWHCLARLECWSIWVITDNCPYHYQLLGDSDKEIPFVYKYLKKQSDTSTHYNTTVNSSKFNCLFMFVYCFLKLAAAACV